MLDHPEARCLRTERKHMKSVTAKAKSISPFVKIGRPVTVGEIDLAHYPEAQASLKRILEKTYGFNLDDLKISGIVNPGETEADLEVWFGERRVHYWNLKDLAYGGDFVVIARPGRSLDASAKRNLPDRFANEWLEVSGYPAGYPCRIDVSVDAKNGMSIDVAPFN